MVTSGSSIFSTNSWQRLLEPARVVGQERVVHDVGQLLLAGQVPRQDALARQVLVAVRALLLLQPVGHLRQVFAVAAMRGLRLRHVSVLSLVKWKVSHYTELAAFRRGLRYQRGTSGPSP